MSHDTARLSIATKNFSRKKQKYKAWARKTTFRFEHMVNVQNLIPEQGQQKSIWSGSTGRKIEI